MKGLEIISITNADENFYRLLGPFLARRSIEKEIGARMYDDDGKSWLVASIEGCVVGFCAVITRGKEVHYQSAYVLPQYRGKGIYRALCERREEFCLGAPARVTCKKENLNMLRSLGFKLKRKKGAMFYELHRK